jgi:hypothetical protein
MLLMLIGIIAAIFGVLLAAAAIGIPRIVNRGTDPQDHADSRAYLQQTGRSAADVAQGNADQVFRQGNHAGSQQAGDAADPPPRSGAS